MTMLDQIEKLLVLQDRDQRLAAILHQRKALPAERLQAERQKAEAETSLEALKASIRENEVARKSLEVDAQAKRDSIAKYKQQQLATRKNDEFTALANEIRRAEEEISKIEDREIELMEAAELLKASLKQSETAISSTRSDIEQRLAGIEARSAALDAQEKDVAAERAQLAASVDDEIREIYERIFRKKGDSALAPMTAGICGGCHMKVSASTAIGVKNSSDVITCDQCGRVLYWAE
jgi:predicted  nucleic acid-binding Zn-ribbon protein